MLLEHALDGADQRPEAQHLAAHPRLDIGQPRSGEDPVGGREIGRPARARKADIVDQHRRRAIGVEHARWGEAAFALVIPREGESVDAEAIRQWANARLAKPQQLVGVEFRKEFPRNALGKVLKRLLRDVKGSP